MPKADAERFIEFGKAIKERFANPIEVSMTKTDKKYTLELPEELLVNHVVLEEDLADGDKISGFAVYVYPTHFGKPILVYRGETVGRKCICQFPTVCTQKLQVVIESESAPHTMKSIKTYYVK